MQATITSKAPCGANLKLLQRKPKMRVRKMPTVSPPRPRMALVQLAAQVHPQTLTTIQNKIKKGMHMHPFLLIYRTLSNPSFSYAETLEKILFTVIGSKPCFLASLTYMLSNSLILLEDNSTISFLNFSATCEGNALMQLTILLITTNPAVAIRALRTDFS